MSTIVDTPVVLAADRQEDPVPVRHDDNTKCHCQGGRLILLIGSFDEYTNDELGRDHPTPQDPNGTLRDFLDDTAKSMAPSLQPYKYFKDPVIAGAGDWLSKQIDPAKMHLHLFGFSTSAGKGTKEPGMQDP